MYISILKKFFWGVYRFSVDLHSLFPHVCVHFNHNNFSRTTIAIRYFYLFIHLYVFDYTINSIDWFYLRVSSKTSFCCLYQTASIPSKFSEHHSNSFFLRRSAQLIKLHVSSLLQCTGFINVLLCLSLDFCYILALYLSFCKLLLIVFIWSYLECLWVYKK